MIRHTILIAGLAALVLPSAAVAQDLSTSSMDRAAPEAPVPGPFAGPASPWEPGGDAPPVADGPLAPMAPKGRHGARRPHRAPAPRDALPGVVRFLQLDEQQTDALRGLLARRHDAVAPLHERVHELERELRRLIDDGAGPARVGAQVLAIHEVRERIRGIVIRSQEAFEGLLDPDQVARYDAVRRAAALQPAVHAFRSLRLLAPPAPDGSEAP